MKKICTLALLFVFTSLIAQSDKRLKGIEEQLEAALEATKAPGFAVAVVEGDKIIYSKGFGYSDVENKVEADANTLYAIGSCTKAFTSSLLGILKYEDELSLDDNPRMYLPNLEFYNSDLNNNLIIKDLMSHRTGLPRHDAAWYLFPTTDTDSLITRLKYQEPFTGIRQEWYYNNFMFLLQGAITAEITGKTWDVNIEERFLKPLNMSRSSTTIEAMKTASNRALGYKTVDDQLKKTDFYDISSMGPAGSINSSVNDMSNWLITWLNNGKFNDKEIIPENYVIDAMSSHSVVAPNLPDEDHPDMIFANYGYGWFLTSYRGHYRVEHGGNIDGFSASTAFFPSDNFGIVVLVNQNGSALPSLVRNIIADRMLESGFSDWTSEYLEAEKKADDSEKEGQEEETTLQVVNTVPSHQLVDYTGIYENPGYGKFKIELKNDSLFAKFKVMDTYLKHYHYDVFEPLEKTEEGYEESEMGGLKFNFRSNDAGDISGLVAKVEPMVNGIVFDRTPNSIDISKDELNAYTGTFDLMGTKLKFFTMQDDKLHLFVEGQPEYELIATAPNKFSIKDLEGFKIEFIDNGSKDPDEVLMIQPNGTFKAKRDK